MVTCGDAEADSVFSVRNVHLDFRSGGGLEQAGTPADQLVCMWQFWMPLACGLLAYTISQARLDGMV